MYIPKEILWFCIGFSSCIILAIIFSIVVDDGKEKINIDHEIITFKNKVKKLFNKIIKKNISTEEKQKDKMTKKEIKKELHQMFKD